MSRCPSLRRSLFLYLSSFQSKEAPAVCRCGGFTFVETICHPERNEMKSRDLRTFETIAVYGVRRSFDLLRSLRMTSLVAERRTTPLRHSLFTVLLQIIFKIETGRSKSFCKISSRSKAERHTAPSTSFFLFFFLFKNGAPLADLHSEGSVVCFVVFLSFRL